MMKIHLTLFRRALYVLLLSASVLASAQVPGGVIGVGAAKGVKQSNEIAKKLSQQTLNDVVRDLARISVNPSVAPPNMVDSVLARIGKLNLPKSFTLPKNVKMPDIFNVCVYLDCLVIQDNALWDKKVSKLCSRLIKRYPNTNEDEWKEFLDNGRFQGNRSLQLAPELRKYWLDHLIGQGEERFGEEDGLYWYRLEE